MQIRDLIGNEIGEGSLLYWKMTGAAQAGGAVVKVLAINPGGLAIPGNGKSLTPGTLTLGLTLTIPPGVPLNDFIVVVDPNETARMQALLDGSDKKVLEMPEPKVQ